MIRRILGLTVALTTTTAAFMGCGSDDEGGGGNGGGTGPDASDGGSGNTGGSADGGSGGAGNTTGGGTGGTAGTAGTGGTPPAGGSGGMPDARSPEQTGDSCQVPEDCYPNVDRSLLSGDVECLTRVEDGYCTHQCETDDDCCAAAGECATDLKQVCAPFENTGLRLCFLSCEEEDLRPPLDSGVLADGAASVDVSPNEYCEREAHPSFTCRSTGGGSANRKVCVPGGVAGDGGPPPGDGGVPPDASLPGEGGAPDASMDGSMGSDGAADGSADAATG